MGNKIKSVYCHGDNENGIGVIHALEKHGGINKYSYSGRRRDVVYYINPITHVIEEAYNDSHMSLVRLFFRKLKPIKMSGRVEKGGEYFTIHTADGLLKVLPCRDCRCTKDDLLYKVGNYYKDESVAKKICDDLNNIIKQNREQLLS